MSGNKSFYELSAKDPTGKVIPMSNYEGKTVLIVNTATRCALAPQFEGLEKLHLKYRDQGLVVLGFPCNQFGFQEPESNKNIEEVCLINHGVSFQLTEKVKVNGGDTHPIFKFLKENLGGLFTSRIRWNFTKFLVGPDGKPFKRYLPTTSPSQIEKDIKKLLKKSGSMEFGR